MSIQGHLCAIRSMETQPFLRRIHTRKGKATGAGLSSWLDNYFEQTYFGFSVLECCYSRLTLHPNNHWVPRRWSAPALFLDCSLQLLIPTPQVLWLALGCLFMHSDDKARHHCCLPKMGFRDVLRLESCQQEKIQRCTLRLRIRLGLSNNPSIEGRLVLEFQDGK